MCGRFTIDIDERFYPRFLLHGKPILNFAPRYNLAPGQDSIVITREEGENMPEIKRWGLLPVWVRDEKSGYRMINAKAETLLEKPAYCHAATNQRCLVPATGFYEWQINSEGSKQPKYIYNPEEKYLSLAGLYEFWRDPVSGKEVKTFSIVTTKPNQFMASIHDRMPLILDHRTEMIWLDRSTKIEALTDILQSTPNVNLEAYNVSTDVNSPLNDNPGLIARI